MREKCVVRKNKCLERAVEVKKKVAGEGKWEERNNEGRVNRIEGKEKVGDGKVVNEIE